MKEFDRDHAWQMPLACKFLDPHYRSNGFEIERYDFDHPMQKRHVDVTLRKEAIFHNVDEKIYRRRRDGRAGEKVSVETWSCSVVGRERRGWIWPGETNDASVLLVCFSDDPGFDDGAWRRVTQLDCLWIPFAPLRDWFWAIGEDNFELQDNLQSNHSISRKVPIAQIIAALGQSVRRSLITESYDVTAWVESDLRAASGWAQRDKYFESLSAEHKNRFAGLKWSLDAAEFGIAEAAE
jgi:hypothetical protein